MLPVAADDILEITADAIRFRPGRGLELREDVRPTPATAERVLSQCGWSPFEGETFRSTIARTLVNGRTVFDGRAIVEAEAAMRLEIGVQR